MKHRIALAVIATALLAAGGLFRDARAQVMDFGRIDSFESMGSGTQRGAAALKTIIDDSDKHMVVFTILESDTDTRIHWKPIEGSSEKTTVMAGPGVQVFQTAGEFKVEALGDSNHAVKYGYMIFRLK